MNIEKFKTISESVYPRIKKCVQDEGVYDPHKCMAIYYQKSDDGQPCYDFPAVLLGQMSISNYIQGCSLLEGLPKTRPEGSITIGDWDVLSKLYPQEFDEKEKPSNEDGYYINIGKNIIIAGGGLGGCSHGAQTLVQLFAYSGESVSAMKIHDSPDILTRSLALDLRKTIPDSERLIYFAGMMNSVKGNCGHFILDPKTPVTEEVAQGNFTSKIASETLFAYKDYGLNMIPWVDVASPLSNSEMTMEQAIESALMISDIFQTTTIGIGGKYFNSEKTEILIELIKSLIETLGESTRFYLRKDAVLACLEHSEIHDNIICWLKFSDKENISLMKKHNITYSVYCAGNTSGFITQRPSVVFDDLNNMVAFASDDEVNEVGFVMPASGSGYVHENDILFAMTSTALGWDFGGGAHTSAESLAKIAFGENGHTYLSIMEVVASAYPEILKRHDARNLRQIAFGYSATPEEWKQVVDIDWHTVSSLTNAYLQAIDEFRPTLHRNTEMLGKIEFGLHSLKFLEQQVTQFDIIRDFYKKAGVIKEDHLLHAAADAADVLQKAAMNFLHEINKIVTELGELSTEATQLNAFQQSIGVLARKLRDLNANNLPKIAELSVPVIM